MPQITARNIQTVCEALIEGLERFKDEAAPRLEQAVKTWGENVEQIATGTLNKPDWLLSQNISSKIRHYQASDVSKIWAIAGFKQDGTAPNTPGMYGRYYEGGYWPDRKRAPVPDHFLRAGKRQAMPALKAEIEKILKERANVLEDILRTKK